MKKIIAFCILVLVLNLIWFSDLVDSVYTPVLKTWPLASLATILGTLRGKRDSYINAGRWKLYETIMSVITGIWMSVMYAVIFDISLWFVPFLVVIYGLWYWLVFDMVAGWFRARKIFYFGSDTFDQKMKKVFRTPEELFIVKIFLIVFVTGIYDSLVIM